MDEFTAYPDPTQPSPTQPPSPEAPKHGIRWIFVGKSGIIRAGWGIALFIIVLVLVGFGLGSLVHHLAPHLMKRGSALTPGGAAIGEGLTIVALLIATGVMGLIERKSVFAYGYKGEARTVRFVSGLVWGFIAITVLVFALYADGLLAFDGRLLHGGAIWKDAAEWAGVFLLVGISEESTLRGYLQWTMARGVGFWWGALLFSFLFGFLHRSNPGESPVGLASAGLIGLVFCLSIWYTGSLWWAVGFHAAWDWGQSYFYGTMDSGLAAQGHLFSEHPVGNLLWTGGKTGPEGSLLILPLIGLIALFMWLWWRRRAQSPFADCAWRPAWSRKPRVMETAPIERAA